MLCSCSSKPVVKVVTQTNTIYVLPPLEWIEPCEPPTFIGNTNLDLLNYSLTQTHTLDVCNANMQRLKQWRQQHDDNH
ncbi:Rz1-like lysis system protein LysC [Shewanella subflava]|uniref:Rz1-like lysis system protein LysC n=1 Tax=Shewanella subflava TaxID=2986476 RepID=UPI0038732A2F